MGSPVQVSRYLLSSSSTRLLTVLLRLPLKMLASRTRKGCRCGHANRMPSQFMAQDMSSFDADGYVTRARFTECSPDGLQVGSGRESEPDNTKRTAIQAKVLDKILKELIFDSKGEVRSAACVWLVSLCTFTGKQPQLLQRLPQIQEAFSNLLGDSSELAQVEPRLHAAQMQAIACRLYLGFPMTNVTGPSPPQV